MSVSSEPWAFILLPLGFAIALWWPKRHGTVIEGSRVGLTRRFVAFYLDFFVIVVGVLPAVSLPALVIEYIATGVWQWSFEREVFRPRDWVSLFIGLAACFGAFYYFKWHFDRGAQTLGRHLMKFKVLPTRERPSFGTRTFVAWVVCSWWPFLAVDAVPKKAGLHLGHDIRNKGEAGSIVLARGAPVASGYPLNARIASMMRVWSASSRYGCIGRATTYLLAASVTGSVPSSGLKRAQKSCSWIGTG